MRWLLGVFFGVFFAACAVANPQQEIAALLDEFLQGASVNDAAVHERFWADDLIYTSSSGARFGKQSIMQGLSEAGEPDGTRYSADQVQVRMHGDIAVLTFRLIAESPDGEREYFYNSGVFRHDDDRWQATTWHATRTEPRDPL